MSYGLPLCVAAAWAVSIVFVRVHRFRASSLALAPWQMLVAALLLFPLAPILEGAWPRIPGRAIAALSYVGPIAAAFAYWAAVEVGRGVRATTMSMVLLAVPAATVSEPPLHRQPSAESSLDGSSSTEAARGIEAFRMRVANYVQLAGAAAPRHIGALFDQQSPYTSLPECWLDEQRIELGIPVRSRQDRCEADDHAIVFGHEHVTIGDLIGRQGDRVRIRE